MASLHKQNGNRPGFKIRWRDPEGKSQVLWLGNMSQRAADTIFRNMSELIRAYANGVRPDGPAEKWSLNLTGRLRGKLASYGLVEPENKLRNSEAGRFLKQFVEAYIIGRTDAKPSTISNYKHAKTWLLRHFDNNTLLTSITPAECERFKRYLETELAISTSNKIIKRCKTMFSFAVRDKLIDESPFESIQLKNDVNRSRDYFVTRQEFEKVFAACPDTHWRLIVALARMSGMRRCEITNLKWSDILWDQDRIRIDSPKTGLRFCPLFPELKPIVENAFDQAADGSVYCVKYRQNQNLGTQLNRIIESAGLKPWEKTFVNLRGSRRTELEECFPNHVVNAWLGHSKKVAERHYLQITDGHWGTAISKPTIGCGNAGGNSNANQHAAANINARITEQKKPAKAGPDSRGRLLKHPLAPPVGLEPTTKRLTAARSTN